MWGGYQLDLMAWLAWVTVSTRGGDRQAKGKVTVQHCTAASRHMQRNQVHSLQPNHSSCPAPLAPPTCSIPEVLEVLLPVPQLLGAAGGSAAAGVQLAWLEP